ncbi:hypothetical protein CRP01_16010 [Flavilitoribacter nigricans DSM 23189 = NBRC 102662]|uniref:Uncharacterized protein n=1 Tax=Flavilitoribacter nigricans (strain ATCC 23147 / DSM 23189 / NBRC 102662 / NCIMB 1420 / SS-2) TaxID=1122177 RepID=A0A2D0NBE6_FLAN2|nr:hypothetical protein CRP01_16010 [Flavilitoribacter nigricans DSM 23189 = NBRC 102662]
MTVDHYSAGKLGKLVIVDIIYFDNWILGNHSFFSIRDLTSVFYTFSNFLPSLFQIILWKFQWENFLSRSSNFFQYGIVMFFICDLECDLLLVIISGKERTNKHKAVPQVKIRIPTCTKN